MATPILHSIRARRGPALIIAAAFASLGGNALAEKRVHPTANPTRPAQSEPVVIRFRALETLDGMYHAEARHRPKEPGCAAQRSRVVRAPDKGRVVRLRLRPPKDVGDPHERRWCV